MLIKFILPAARVLLCGFLFGVGANSGFALNTTFENGNFESWLTIGNTQIVDSSFGIPVIGKHAALLSTGTGAVPLSELLAFLEGNGIYIGDLFDDLKYSGGLGSAIITDYFEGPYSSFYYQHQLKSLSNGSSGPGAGRGAYALLGRESDGRGGGFSVVGQNAYEISDTPFAFQSTDYVTGGGFSGGPAERYKFAYFVWELNPNANDAGFGLLIDAVPESGSTITMLSAVIILLGFIRRKRIA